MMTVKPCDKYHAVLEDKDVFRGADGKSVFKIYYMSIIGRDDPTKTEWPKCDMSRESFVGGLENLEGLEGVGFITAFPHITKVFRFDPQRESIMNVRSWRTPDMTPLDLARAEGYMEFACLAEGVVAGHEFAFWAEAESVEKYLEKRSSFADGRIVRSDKLLAYWQQ